MPHPIARISSLARLLDFRHASNRYAVAVSTIAAVVGGIAAAITGELSDAFGGGVRAGLAVFLAWALGREIDPDDPRSAALGAPLALLALLVGRPALAAVVAALIAMRVTLRPTGVPSRPLDLAVLVGASAYMATRPTGLVAVAALAAAAALDTALSDPGPTWHRWVVPAVLAVGGLAFGFAGQWAEFEAPDLGGLLIGSAGVVSAAFLVVATPAPMSVGDHTRRRLHRSRLRAARLLGLAIALGYAAAGQFGIGAMGPLWAAFLGAGAVAVARRVRAA